MGKAFNFDLGSLRKVASIQANVTIHFHRMTTRERNALVRALDTGVLTSYSGATADIYKKFRREFNWPRPHEWNTRATWGGVRIYVTREEWNTKVAPFLVPLLPDGVAPEHIRNYQGRDYGKLLGRLNGNAVDKSGLKLPQPVIDYLKSIDTRDRAVVQDLIERVESLGTYTFT